MAFSFSDLNLGSVEVGGGSGAVIPPGRHLVTVSDAELKDTRAGGKMVVVRLAEQSGSQRSIRHYINIHVPSSTEATRIGREQLKSLLVHGGHDDPDNIGQHGVGSIRDLKVGVFVVKDSYSRDGMDREGSKVRGYFDPDEMTIDRPPEKTNSTTQKLDDKIPF